MNTQVEMNTDNLPVKKNTSQSTKAGLTFQVVTIQKNARIRKLQIDNFSKEDKDGNMKVGKVRMDKDTSIFVTANIEYIAKVMVESVLRAWMTNSNESLRLNHEIIHGSLAQPNNSELNAIFPHSVLEIIRDSVSDYRTIDEAYKNKKKEKPFDQEAYETALGRLRELYPDYLSTDKDTGIERFTFSYNCSNKLVKICKNIYNNNDVHTHETQEEQEDEEHQQDEEQEEHDEENDEHVETSKKNGITLNEQAKLYFTFLIDYLYNRIVMTTVKSTSNLCDSNKELNTVKGAKKTIKEVNVRVTLETIIPTKLGLESMNYASDRVKEYRKNKELLAMQKFQLEQAAATEQSVAEQASEAEQNTETEHSEAEQSETEKPKKGKKSKKEKSSETGGSDVESSKKSKKSKKEKSSETVSVESKSKKSKKSKKETTPNENDE